jgi:hypothetical protein
MTDRSLRLTLFVHVFLFALVVGVFWGTWFSLSRSMSAITAATFLEVAATASPSLATLWRSGRCRKRAAQQASMAMLGTMDVQPLERCICSGGLRKAG